MPKQLFWIYHLDIIPIKTVEDNRQRLATEEAIDLVFDLQCQSYIKWLNYLEKQ